jgi:hypothetical protein
MASPGEIVTAMFERARQIADDQKTAFTDATQRIKSEVQALKPQVPPEREIPPFVLEELFKQKLTAPADAPITKMTFPEYRDRIQEIQDMVTERTLEMFDRFMPNGALLDEGDLKQLLMDELGGTGIDPAVDDAIWARDRNRIMADGQRAQQELMATFAARRFPIPPGALVNAVNLAQQNMQDRIAEASAAIVAKRADQEVAHRQFILERLTQLRVSVISAAGDLLRTIVGMVDQSTGNVLKVEDYNMQVHNLRKAYLDAINQQYMLTRDKTAVGKADARFENKEAVYKNAVNAVEKMIQAFTDEAKALSTQAAAILNALHGSVSTSASSSLGASYSYSNDTTGPVSPYTGFS